MLYPTKQRSVEHGFSKPLQNARVFHLINNSFSFILKTIHCIRSALFIVSRYVSLNFRIVFVPECDSLGLTVCSFAFISPTIKLNSLVSLSKRWTVLPFWGGRFEVLCIPSNILFDTVKSKEFKSLKKICKDSSLQQTHLL